MTRRTFCGSYCCTIFRRASCSRFTSIGRMNTPPLAIAPMAITICSRVTATPCPIGICAMEYLPHCVRRTHKIFRAGFVRQRNARQRAQPKSGHVIVKFRRLQFDADFGRADVRGFLQNLLHGEVAKMVVLRVVQGDAAIVKNSVLAENLSFKPTMCSFSAPEITMVLNVEPGSITR